MSAFAVSLAAAAVAGVVSWIGSGVAAASGPQQAPVDRSNHVAATPVGAGLGIAAGVAAGLIVGGLFRVPGAELGSVIGVFLMIVIAAVVVTLGALDDVFDLPPRLKFAAFGAAAAAAAYAGGGVDVLPAWGDLQLGLPTWAALGGGALWVFTAVNATNFMDGADGLAGGAVAVASVALAAAAAAVGADVAALCALVLAAALAGFLPWNAPNARVFMGDTGSLFIGLWFAGAALLFVAEAPAGAVYLPPLFYLPILADTLLTLALRARRGRQLLSAHSEHAYQVRMRRDGRHHGVARAAAVRAAGLGVLGVAAMVVVDKTEEPGWALAAFMLGAAVMTVAWARDRRGS